MDEKEKSAAPPVDIDDMNTTAPNPKPAPWKMPQPVFRQTSGKLPRGFEKNSGLSVADTPQAAPSDVPVNEAPLADPATTYPEPKPKSPVLKIVVVLLGLGAMIAFLVVFLTLVYFLFLRSE